MARFIRPSKLETVAISAALTPDAARSVLVLGFNDEAEMHHPIPNLSKIRQCVAHSFMIQQISILGRIL